MSWKVQTVESYQKELNEKVQDIKTFKDFRNFLDRLSRSSFGEVFYKPIALKFDALYKELQRVITEAENDATFKCLWDGSKLTQIRLLGLNDENIRAFICKNCGRVFSVSNDKLMHIGSVPESWAIKKIIMTGKAKLTIENGCRFVRVIEERGSKL